MRFAGNTSNVGSWIQAGKAGSRGSSDFFKVARANSPDYGGLAETAMKARSSERVAVTQAEAEVAKAGLKAKTRMENTKTKIEASEKILDKKIGAKRMAGVVGALGAVAGGAFMGIENKKADARQAARDAKDEARWQEQLGIMRTQAGRESTYEPTQFIPTQFDPSSVTQTNDYGGAIDTTPPGTTPPAAPGDQQTSTSQPFQSTGSGIRTDVFTYLTSTKGMEKNTALGLMANIDRESGFDPKVMSGDDGGYGGLFQWKGARQTPAVVKAVKAGDWQAQIDYALTEPENLSLVKPGAYQKMSFESPQQAADWFMDNWERPSDRTSGSKKHTQFLSGYNF